MEHLSVDMRLFLDVVAFLFIIVLGIVLNVLSGFDANGLNFVARYENVIWVVATSVVGFSRAKADVWRKTRRSLMSAVFEWCVILAAAHFALLWLDVIFQPRDNFKTVFASTFLVFFVPSIVVSVISYSLTHYFSHRDSGESGRKACGPR